MAHLEDAGKRRSETIVDPDLTEAGAEPGYARERWLAIATVGFALVVWAWASRTAASLPLFFPAPSSIFRALGASLSSGVLAVHLRATLSRVFAGVVLGGLTGLIVGLMVGWSPRLRAFVDPFVAMLHPIPKLAV